MNCFVIQCSLSKLNLSNPDITCFVLHIYVWYEWGIMTMACFKFSNKPTLFCLCHIQSVKHQYMMIVLCQRYYVTFHGYFKSTAPWVKKNKLYCMHIMIRDMKNKQRYKSSDEKKTQDMQTKTKFQGTIAFILICNSHDLHKNDLFHHLEYRISFVLVQWFKDIQ